MWTPRKHWSKLRGRGKGVRVGGSPSGSPRYSPRTASPGAGGFDSPGCGTPSRLSRVTGPDPQEASWGGEAFGAALAEENSLHMMQQLSALKQVLSTVVEGGFEGGESPGDSPAFGGRGARRSAASGRPGYAAQLKAKAKATEKAAKAVARKAALVPAADSPSKRQPPQSSPQLAGVEAAGPQQQQASGSYVQLMAQLAGVTSERKTKSGGGGGSRSKGSRKSVFRSTFGPSSPSGYSSGGTSNGNASPGIPAGSYPAASGSGTSTPSSLARFAPLGAFFASIQAPEVTAAQPNDADLTTAAGGDGSCGGGNEVAAALGSHPLDTDSQASGSCNETPFETPSDTPTAHAPRPAADADCKPLSADVVRVSLTADCTGTAAAPAPLQQALEVQDGQVAAAEAEAAIDLVQASVEACRQQAAEQASGAAVEAGNMQQVGGGTDLEVGDAADGGGDASAPPTPTAAAVDQRCMEHPQDSAARQEAEEAERVAVAQYEAELAAKFDWELQREAAHQSRAAATARGRASASARHPAALRSGGPQTARAALAPSTARHLRRTTSSSAASARFSSAGAAAPTPHHAYGGSYTPAPGYAPHCTPSHAPPVPPTPGGRLLASRYQPFGNQVQWPGSYAGMAVPPFGAYQLPGSYPPPLADAYKLALHNAQLQTTVQELQAALADAEAQAGELQAALAEADEKLSASEAALADSRELARRLQADLVCARTTTAAAPPQPLPTPQELQPGQHGEFQRPVAGPQQQQQEGGGGFGGVALSLRGVLKVGLVWLLGKVLVREGVLNLESLAGLLGGQQEPKREPAWA